MKFIYVGPYAEVLIPVVDHKRDACRKPSECIGAESPFCPNCGVETAKRHHTVATFKPGWMKLCQDVFSRLYCENMTCEAPFETIEDEKFIRRTFEVGATAGLDARPMSLYSYMSKAKELTYVNIPGELKWFKTEFEPELQRIGDFCEGRLAVRWGVITHCDA